MGDEFEVDGFMDLDEDTDDEVGPDDEELEEGDDDEEAGEDEEEL